MLQHPIIEMLRPSRLEERDRKRFGEWRNKRVITMLRLGLVVGAAMTTLVHFADRLIDVEIASQVLPYRLSVAVVVLLFGSLTYLRVVRDNPDPLVIGLATFLSLSGAAIAARLPDHAGFLMVSGELVLGIFTVIIVHGALTVGVVAVVPFCGPPRDLLILGRLAA